MEVPVYEREKEQEKKRQQLVAFCRANGILVDPEANRTELLAKVRAWKKMRTNNPTNDRSLASEGKSLSPDEDEDEDEEIGPRPLPGDLPKIVDQKVVCSVNEETRKCEVVFQVLEWNHHLRDAEYKCLLMIDEKRLETQFESVEDGTESSDHHGMRACFKKIGLGQKCRLEVHGVYDGQVFQVKGGEIENLETPCLLPLVPHRVRFSGVRKRELKLRWQEPKCTGGAKIIGYEGQVLVDGEFKTVYSGDKCGFELSKLEPGTSYSLRVRARNSLGFGDWSTPETVRTNASVPSVPGEPRHVPGSLAPSQIYVEWDPPTHTYGSQVSEYRVEVLDETSEEFRVVYNGPENRCLLTKGLSPAQSVKLRVRARNIAGNSQYSKVATLSTIGCAPKAPPPPKVKIENDGASVYVEWKPPSCMNGAPVTRYSLEINNEDDDENAERVAYDGERPNCLLKCLHPGKRYSLQVVAKNDYGWSDPSEPITVTLNPRPPRAPKRPRVSHCNHESNSHIAGDDLLFRLRWSRLKQDGCNGSEIKYYNVYLRRLRRFDSERASSAFFESNTAIENEYSLPLFDASIDKEIVHGEELLAIDSPFEVGQECDARYSEDGYFYTGIIQGLRRDESDSSIWCEVKFNGYDDKEWVEQRNIRNRLRVGDECMALVYSKTKECDQGDFDGKTEEMAHAVITAVVDDGYFVKFPGQALAIQHTKVQDVSPLCCSTPLSVSSSSTAISTCSTSSPQSAQSKKKASIHDDRHNEDEDCADWIPVYRGNDTNILLPAQRSSYKGVRKFSIEPGVTYEFCVTAMNDAGESPKSEVSSIVAKAKAPNRPPRPIVVGNTKNSLTIKLRHPLRDNGAPIDGWRIGLAPAKRVKVATQDKLGHVFSADRAKITDSFQIVAKVLDQDIAVIPNLMPGKVHALRVSAKNSQGYGPWSETVAGVTQAGKPGVPECVSCSPEGESRARIRWQAPEQDGGFPITGYQVQMSIYPTQSLREAKQGNRNNESSSDDSSTVFSLESSNGLGEPSKFFCPHEGGLLSESFREFTVDGLPAGSKVAIRVRAANCLGFGPESACVSCKTDPSPPGPIEVVTEIASTCTCITMKWSSPVDNGGSTINGYELHIEPGVRGEDDGDSWIAPPDGLEFLPSARGFVYFAIKTKFQVKNLIPGQTYFARVRALNARGPGPCSKWTQVTTKEKASNKVTLLPPENLRPLSLVPLQLGWENRNDENQMIEFKLEMARGNSNRFKQVYQGHSRTFSIPETELDLDTSYRFRCRCVSKNGGSPFGSVCTVKIPPLLSSKCDTTSSGTTQRDPRVQAPTLAPAKLEMDTPEPKGKKKLVKASTAIRWRRMKWHEKFPLLSALLTFLAWAAFLYICIYIYYA